MASETKQFPRTEMVVLTEDQADRLRDMAAREQRSKSWLLRQAWVEYAARAEAGEAAVEERPEG